MSKRTLETFFAPKPANKKPKLVDNAPPQKDTSPLGSPSTHSTYPFPIPQFPSNLVTALTPIKPAREVKDQPDLDLLYFEPYFTPSIAKQLFEFLRSELFFYRVVYKINRFGKETEVNTPR